MNLGAPELIIILVIVIVLFGAGRIGRLGREMGTAVREFRRGLNDGNEKSQESPETKNLADSKN
ncbi:MAG: hypothetical protein OHK0023_27230 [Anaerolineae bacterium]